MVAGSSRQDVEGDDWSARGHCGDGVYLSIVVPCRNEIDAIDSFLRSALTQSGIDRGLEVIIAEGLSDDGTRERLEEWSIRDERLRIVNNPGKIVSTGLNRAIVAAQGQIIARMDVHSEYASDYALRCVETLLATGADCVGGPWRAVGRSYLGRAIAAGFGSALGSGGARSRLERYEGEVDSVYLGCWHRQTLIEIGLFDEELVRNQDDELSLRLKRRGGRIWQSPSIRSVYHPRESLVSSFRQYYQYGFWKVRVIQKHGQAAALRHLVPAAAVVSGALLGIVAIFSPSIRIILAGFVAFYLLGVTAASIASCAVTREWKLLPALPLVFGTYHLGYGIGFCRGVVDFALLKRAPAQNATRLTR